MAHAQAHLRGQGPSTAVLNQGERGKGCNQPNPSNLPPHCQRCWVRRYLGAFSCPRRLKERLQPAPDALTQAMRQASAQRANQVSALLMALACALAAGGVGWFAATALSASHAGGVVGGAAPGPMGWGAVAGFAIMVATLALMSALWRQTGHVHLGRAQGRAGTTWLVAPWLRNQLCLAMRLKSRAAPQPLPGKKP
ncbi:hypothetical protein [Formicincola oecophyllae]|uniref:hypothetical protein n=1 Tax=Formicincola oecophyllae TaxID=2558361 RepID=UPI001F0E5D44|nr:hypothetical protein [Formicincola oecophyllae]